MQGGERPALRRRRAAAPTASGGRSHAPIRCAALAGAVWPAVASGWLLLALAGACADGDATPELLRARIDPDAAWTRHTIRGGVGGADGVDLADIDGDGNPEVTSGWEQSGIVTLSFHPGSARLGEPWPTIALDSRLPRVEDAIFADVDGDGHLDVVAATEARQVAVLFAPADPALYRTAAAWTRVTIAAAAGLQRWIKVAYADIDGDGTGDIVAGGKVSPATVGWLRAPADPRSPDGWVYTPLSAVGWTMSLEPRDLDADGDVDLVLSDRLKISAPALDYTLRGSRWLENPGRGAAWTNHPIGHPFGGTDFLDIVDFDGDGVDDIVDGGPTATGDAITCRRNAGDWLSWTDTEVPSPLGVGRFQSIAAGDVDLDGEGDLVVGYSHAEHASGVVWLGQVGSLGAERGEISGAPGAKFDNVVLVDLDGDGDLDVVTSEQVEQLGVIWYENPLLSGDPVAPSARPSPSGR